MREPPALRPGRSAAVAAAAVLAAVACSPPAPDEAGYLERLIEERAALDRSLAEGPDSPVPLDRRSWMLPVRYYEPDLSYRVPAHLKLAEEQPVFEVPTSTGQLRPMQRVGTLEFALHGESHSLAALVDLTARDELRLFIPFRDETSGEETYAAGRYLDLDRTPTGIYNLDFNRAYHPMCYYDEQYDCPFPPPENRLPAPIRAGERLPPADEQRFPAGGPPSPPAGGDGAGAGGG